MIEIRVIAKKEQLKEFVDKLTEWLRESQKAVISVSFYPSRKDPRKMRAYINVHYVY